MFEFLYPKKIQNSKSYRKRKNDDYYEGIDQDDDIFVEVDDNQQDDQYSEYDTDIKNETNQNSTGWIIGIVGIIVLFCIIAITVWYFLDKKDSPKNTPNVSNNSNDSLNGHSESLELFDKRYYPADIVVSSL